MTSLRKSCRNCTKSKRKCIVQSPSCARCAQKGLQCTYDLEHIGAPQGVIVPFPQLGYSSSTCATPGYCVLKSLQHRGSSIDPAVCTPGHSDNLIVLRSIFLAVPGMLKAGSPAVFVHPRLHLQLKHDHCSVFLRPETSYDAYEEITRLYQLDMKSMNSQEMLSAVQAFILHFATLLFSSNAQFYRIAERSISILTERAELLLMSACTKMLGNQSAWQQWLFGESLRRTIFAAYALVMAYSSFKHGYCSNWLFMESLPFDRRAGLWMAKSPQAWMAAAKVQHGGDVGEQLSSFHEYAEGLRGSSTQLCGDVLLDMLVTVHNGPVGM